MILSQSNSQTFKKYFFSYLFLASATIFLPFRQTLFSLIFILAAVEFYISKNKFDLYFYYFSLITTISLLLQTFYFDRFNLSSTIRLYMNIFLPYFLLKTIGKDYIKYFIKIVYIISIISFVFYFPSLFSDTIHNYIGKIAPALGTDTYLDNQNFIIFTWEGKSEGFLRNSGNFTEPGYFASILILAMSFNLLHQKKILNKENIVLTIAIITTFSTSGYIALFYVFTLKILFTYKNKYKYLLIPLMLYIAYESYVRLDFLQNKVTNQFQTQVEEGVERGRFGSTILDFKDLKKYPLIGRGQTKATRFDEVEFWEGDQAPRPILNGVTDTLLKYGIIGFIFYLILLVNSLKHYSKIHHINKKGVFIILGSVFIVTFAQPILLTPIFLSLVYFKDIKYNNDENFNFNTKL